MHDTESAELNLTTGEHCAFRILLLTSKSPLLLHFLKGNDYNFCK